MATVNQYQPKSAAGTQQQQLLAKNLGLDLNLLQQFGQNPAAFKEQYAKYFDKASGQYKIPDIIPGGLIGAPQGPNGTTLAAGSTPTNPLDLLGIKSSAVQPGSVTFLPPYLQPNQNQSGSEVRPVNPASMTMPSTPSMAGTTTPMLPSILSQSKGPIDFPAYLRGAKGKNTGGFVAYG